MKREKKYVDSGLAIASSYLLQTCFWLERLEFQGDLSTLIM